MAEYISQLYPKGKGSFITGPRSSFRNPERPLSPFHRAELIEELERLGQPVPDRRLLEADYLATFNRDLTDL